MYSLPNSPAAPLGTQCVQLGCRVALELSSHRKSPAPSASTTVEEKPAMLKCRLRLGQLMKKSKRTEFPQVWGSDVSGPQRDSGEFSGSPWSMPWAIVGHCGSVPSLPSNTWFSPGIASWHLPLETKKKEHEEKIVWSSVSKCDLFHLPVAALRGLICSPP